jgi:hypothetical protein
VEGPAFRLRGDIGRVYVRRLIRKLGKEFQAETIASAVANDSGDSGPTQCLEFDFGQVSGIEMNSRAERHPAFAHLEPKPGNHHFRSPAYGNSYGQVDLESLPTASIF